MHRPREAPERRGLRSAAFWLRTLIPASILALLMVAVVPNTSGVFAADVFGGLRAPGQPAFIAAHRGDRSVAPENTMPAFRAAFANPALAFVETDVQLTRDGVPVLFHDTTLERVTGRRGSIGDYDYRQLRAMDAGSWFAREFSDARIPRLETFLDALGRTDKSALIELKAVWSVEEVQRIIDMIDARPLSGRIMLEAFSIETLTNIQVVAPQFPRLMLARELPADPVPMARRFGVLAIATTAQAITAEPEAIRLMHGADLGVLCYTLNSDETWAEARALGVDGIITDVPSELDAWFASTTRGT
ncbi:MAG: glycerophosphodiester phosphodiesterase family protein [Leifsonia sp.]